VLARRAGAVVCFSSLTSSRIFWQAASISPSARSTLASGVSASAPSRRRVGRARCHRAWLARARALWPVSPRDAASRRSPLLGCAAKGCLPPSTSNTTLRPRRPKVSSRPYDANVSRARIAWRGDPCWLAAATNGPVPASMGVRGAGSRAAAGASRHINCATRTPSRWPTNECRSSSSTGVALPASDLIRQCGERSPSRVGAKRGRGPVARAVDGTSRRTTRPGDVRVPGPCLPTTDGAVRGRL
jgi:hypothetical protein